jgi:hypothetical protein
MSLFRVHVPLALALATDFQGQNAKGTYNL